MAIKIPLNPAITLDKVVKYLKPICETIIIEPTTSSEEKTNTNGEDSVEKSGVQADAIPNNENPITEENIPQPKLRTKKNVHFVNAHMMKKYINFF